MKQFKLTKIKENQFTLTDANGTIKTEQDFQTKMLKMKFKKILNKGIFEFAVIIVT